MPHRRALRNDSHICHSTRFFLLGQAKCGTTEVFAHLSLHPAMLRAGGHKEQHFWSREWYTAEVRTARQSTPGAMAA